MSGPRPPRLEELSGAALPPFTSDIIYWVRESIAQLPPDKRLWTDVFYEELFTLAPESRSLFPEDMTPQSDRLLGALLAAARGMDQPELIEPHLRRWGVIHRRAHGVSDELYVYVGQALVRTMNRLLPNSSSMIHSCWVAVYYWMAAVMIDGADQAQTVDQNPALLLKQQPEPQSEPETPPAIASVHRLRPRGKKPGIGPRRAAGG